MVQLLVFDSRRGNREGEELQKVLAFHPAETPAVEQITTAGLLHGLLLFSSNFCQDGWEVAETDKSVWVAHQAEPSIWFALAAPRAWVPRHCAEANLQSLLAQAHQIISLLHGPVEGLLLQDASGQSVRRAIQPVLEHLGRQLGNTLSWQHRQLRNPLGDVALVPQLQLAPPASMAVQNFVNAVQLAGVSGSRAVEGVMLLHQAHVLWSSLAPEDSAALYSLAATALLHPPSGMQRGGEAREQSVLESSCWHQLPSKFVVLRPGVAAGQEGAAAAQQDGEAAQVPTVLIQSGQERCHLLPYKEGKLWVLLLVAAAVTMSAHALSTLQAVLATPAQQLAAQVSQELRSVSTEPGHVPGYRYLYRDLGTGTCAASPRVKISAMLHHSRALAVAVRESLARLEPAPGGETLCGWENGGWEGGSSGGMQLGSQGTQGAGPEGSGSGDAAAGDRLAAQWAGPDAHAQQGQHAQHGGVEGQSVGGSGGSGKGWMAAGQGHYGPGKWLRSPRDSLEGQQQGPPHPGSQSPADEARAAALTPLRLGPPALRWQSLDRGHQENIYSPPAELRGSASGAFDAVESAGQQDSSSSLSQPSEQQAEPAAAEALAPAVQQLGLGNPQPAAAAAAAAEVLQQGEASRVTAVAGGSSSAAAAAAEAAAAAGAVQQHEGAEQGREHNANSSGASSAGSQPGSPASSGAAPAAAASQAVDDGWGRALDAAELDNWESSSEPAPPPVVDIPPAVGANDVHEVFVRSSQDCWAAARAGLRLSRQLLVVRERKTERNLGEAMAVMDAFTDSFPC